MHEVRTGNRVLWAWCLADGHPGFTEITFTADNGFELVDAPDRFALGRVLFSVPASRETTPTRGDP